MASNNTGVDLTQIWGDERRIEDNWSSIYDHVYHEVQYCYRLYKEAVADLVYSAWKDTGGRILEVGCGTGAVLACLRERGVPPGCLAGVDISPLMIAEASAKLPASEFAAIPFEQFEPEHRFDCVFFCGALHHLADKGMVATKLNAIMPPDAPLVICEPNGNWMFSRLFWNRAARVINPLWIFWRLFNHRKIAALEQKHAGKGEPAFHEHISAPDIEVTFAPHFDLVSSHTGFAVTRLHEGVVLSPGLTISLLRMLDKAASTIAPHGGGSIAMTFRKRGSS